MIDGNNDFIHFFFIIKFFYRFLNFWQHQPVPSASAIRKSPGTNGSGSSHLHNYGRLTPSPGASRRRCSRSGRLRFTEASAEPRTDDKISRVDLLHNIIDPRGRSELRRPIRVQSGFDRRGLRSGRSRLPVSEQLFSRRHIRFKTEFARGRGSQSPTTSWGRRSRPRITVFEK